MEWKKNQRYKNTKCKPTWELGGFFTGDANCVVTMVTGLIAIWALWGCCCCCCCCIAIAWDIALRDEFWKEIKKKVNNTIWQSYL